MLKLSLVSLVFAFGCSSTTPVHVTPPTAALSQETIAATAGEFASLITPPTKSTTVTATITHCTCSDGWSFVMNPCNETQCSNICYHGHHFSAGFCR